MSKEFSLLSILLIFFFIIGCSSDKNVSIVKNGILPIDKSLTVGEAFESYSYFKHGKWESFKSDRKRQAVQFIGTFKDEVLLSGVKQCETQGLQIVKLAEFGYDSNKKIYNLAHKNGSDYSNTEKNEVKKNLELSKKELELAEITYQKVQMLSRSINSVKEVDMIIQFIVNRDDSFQPSYVGYKIIFKNQKEYSIDSWEENLIQPVKDIYANEISSANIIYKLSRKMAEEE